MLRSRGLGRLMNPRRIPLTLGAAAGGLLAAAFLPMAVAFADDNGFVPLNATIVPTEVTGMPPGAEVIMGQEDWIPWDFTTGQGSNEDEISGVDTETIMGSMTNNLFAAGNYLEVNGPNIIFDSLTVDLFTFGNGWGLEWVDLPPLQPSTFGAEMGELLITPMGDFPLMGTFFS